jgi:hypothetical protein
MLIKNIIKCSKSLFRTFSIVKPFERLYSDAKSVADGIAKICGEPWNFSS